jgi:hypothetical protein
LKRALKTVQAAGPTKAGSAPKQFFKFVSQSQCGCIKHADTSHPPSLVRNLTNGPDIVFLLTHMGRGVRAEG